MHNIKYGGQLLDSMEKKKTRKGARELRDAVVNWYHLVCHLYVCVIISLTLSICFPLLYVFVCLSVSLPLNSNHVHVSFYMQNLQFGPYGLLTQVPIDNYRLPVVSLSTCSWEALTASIALPLDKGLSTLVSVHRRLFSQWVDSLGYVSLLHHADWSTESWRTSV